MSQPDLDPAAKANLEPVALIGERNKLPNNNFITRVYGLLNLLPPSLRVIFDLKIDRGNEDNDELVDRLQKTGVLIEDQDSGRLIVQSPLIASIPISAVDTMSLARHPFNIFTIGGVEYLEVNPAGKYAGFKKFMFTSAQIQQISVSRDKTMPLSSALTNDDKVISVPEWQWPEGFEA